MIGAEQINSQKKNDENDFGEAWIMPLEDEVVGLAPIVPVLADKAKPANDIDHLAEADRLHVLLLVLNQGGIRAV